RLLGQVHQTDRQRMTLRLLLCCYQQRFAVCHLGLLTLSLGLFDR
ncbi:hypothetical protein D046_0698B, partial [Vibrio parahaemolyticus V-223/04]